MSQCRWIVDVNRLFAPICTDTLCIHTQLYLYNECNHVDMSFQLAIALYAHFTKTRSISWKFSKMNLSWHAPNLPPIALLLRPPDVHHVYLTTANPEELGDTWWQTTKDQRARHHQWHEGGHLSRKNWGTLTVNCMAPQWCIPSIHHPTNHEPFREKQHKVTKFPVKFRETPWLTSPQFFHSMDRSEYNSMCHG